MLPHHHSQELARNQDLNALMLYVVNTDLVFFLSSPNAELLSNRKIINLFIFKLYNACVSSFMLELEKSCLNWLYNQNIF